MIAALVGARFDDGPARFQKLALAALKLMAGPTEAMVDAAHAAASDGVWVSGSISVRFTVSPTRV